MLFKQKQKRGTTLNQMNLVQDLNKSRLTLFYPKDCITVLKYNEYEIPVVLKSRFLMSCGFMFSCATRLADSSTIIVVDKYFMELPEECKDFLLFHELGHIINGDTNLTETEAVKEFNNRTQGILSEREIKADKFASERITYKKAKKVLKYLVKNYSLAEKEMKLRIKALSK